MMKKVLALFLAVMLFASLAPTAMAANREARQPDLYLDGKLIDFADQTTYITDEGRTLVPVRGFFEELGFTVEWDAENYIATALSPDKQFAIFFVINSKTLYMFDLENQYEYQLDVPPQILNGRTMIPMYFISDLFGYTVVWSEENYCVNILPPAEVNRNEGGLFFPGFNTDNDETTTKDTAKPEDVLKVSLSADKTDVKVGDEVTVYVEIEGNGSYKPSGFQSVFKYDKSALELVKESSAIIDSELTKQESFLALEQDVENGTGVMCVPMNAVEDFSSKIYAITFKVLKDEIINISLDDSYSDEDGYSTMILLENPSFEDLAYEGKMLDMTNAVLELK